MNSRGIVEQILLYCRKITIYAYYFLLGTILTTY